MARRLDIRAPDFAARFDALVAGKRDEAQDVEREVAAIVENVRARGDAALIEYTERFDGVSLTPARLRIGAGEIAEATARCSKELRAALVLAAERIAAYHERQRPHEAFYTDAAGVGLGERWTALASVGLYVPGGRAAYPSSVLMNAIPAKVAGVARLVMAVPSPKGVLSDAVLAAAEIAGIDEIYRVGGAQAVAALAYGTASIVPVDKIVGPGNAYVAAAKRQVFGRVGIDLIAGPSEVLILADGANDADWIAVDLLAQAEHDPAAQAVLITDDAGLAERVEEAVRFRLKTLPRSTVAGASWDAHGAVIVVERLEQAPPLIDRLAPEHLELAIDEPESFARRVRNAGAIFLGRHTPEAIGDYVAGTNHVLPTDRSARFASGLSVLDFMKRTELVRCDAESLRRIGPAAVTLAEAEGLSAHALSIAVRLNIPRGD
ncbi:MAG TPA: histidinol dehydrogenase [Alphaproteobacteria bacterium]|nr:histidinol dehydrogenase [Alphaproteobacteria bacterium]